VGRITRVSVAVLVDGTYKTATQKGGTPEREYVPRGSEEIQKIEALREASGQFRCGSGRHGGGRQHSL